MSLGRPEQTSGDVRDIAADYLNAHIEEYKSYLNSGNQERANQVAVVLRQLGHEVDKAPIGVKERAVDTPDLETAVPDAPKRRGRPKAEPTT